MNHPSNNPRAAILQSERKCAEAFAHQHSKPWQKREDRTQTLSVFPRTELSANLQGFKCISDQKQRFGTRIKASGSSRASGSDECSVREKKMTLYPQVIISNLMTNWFYFILSLFCLVSPASPHTLMVIFNLNHLTVDCKSHILWSVYFIVYIS